MTVHHLDCATMCPYGGRRLLGSGGPLTGRLVGHCLLIETDRGLVLVDTGFGTGDVADPGRLGRAFLTAVRPRLTLAGTALHRIRALGHDPRDVRHIVLTHLDADHAGGLGDFPEARVHVLAEELAAARTLATRGERDRYRPVQWAHRPHWSNTGPAARSGTASGRSARCPASTPTSCSSPCRATPAATAASPSAPAPTGSCTAATPTSRTPTSTPPCADRPP